MNPIDYWYKKYLKEKEKKLPIKPPVPEPLKLTWQDVEQLILLSDNVAREAWFFEDKKLRGEELYKEVLRRFNEMKK